MYTVHIPDNRADGCVFVCRSFKLDNRLREAEPKIKKIGDYEQQIDKFEENQLLWCVQSWFVYALCES